MCGIFGFHWDYPDKEAIVLDNYQRGNQALSLLHVDNSVHTYISPQPDEVATLIKHFTSEANFMLGHFRAATVAPRAKWDNHPFYYKGWLVAHNGTLKVDPIPFGHFTDSSEIPRQIYLHGWRGLSNLNGTFACWAVNTETSQMYLFCWGAPLHLTHAAFSSTPFPGSEPLVEGLVVRWPQRDVVTEFSPPWHPYKPQEDRK